MLFYILTLFTFAHSFSFVRKPHTAQETAAPVEYTQLSSLLRTPFSMQLKESFQTAVNRIKDYFDKSLHPIYDAIMNIYDDFEGQKKNVQFSADNDESIDSKLNITQAIQSVDTLLENTQKSAPNKFVKGFVSSLRNSAKGAAESLSNADSSKSRSIWCLPKPFPCLRSSDDGIHIFDGADDFDNNFMTYTVASLKSLFDSIKERLSQLPANEAAQYIKEIKEHFGINEKKIASFDTENDSEFTPLVTRTRKYDIPAEKREIIFF